LELENAASADGLIGQASIVDGETLEIHGNRIRLYGVDAPE
jgi:endonuclease YncB( thermonuclease family)